MSDTNPYDPPRTPDSPVLTPSDVELTWSWKNTLLLGFVAGAISTVCVMLYMEVWGIPGRTGQSPPIWVHQLRAACYYTAGGILGVGFVWMTRRGSVQFSNLAIGAVASYFAQFIAEMIALFGMSLGILDQWLGIFVNIALRSTFLAFVVCWLLRVPVRPKRLAGVVFVGTVIWMVVFGIFGFSMAWSLIAAIELKYILQPPKKVRSRSDYLPDKIEAN